MARENLSQKAARLEKEAADLKEQLVQSKLETSREKKKRRPLKETVQQAGDKIENTAEDITNAAKKTRGWLRRDNLWALAVPFVIWVAVLYKFTIPSIKNAWAADHAAQRDTIQTLRLDLVTDEQKQNLDSMRAGLHMRTPLGEAIKKKIWK